ncbi:acyl carrier protein [Flavobacterium sp. 3HN19-14]|uniref:acyl carrier protein n=1 Tax=Flavobacterium sp. 3HN19-14 TaxID=3448133 RepID=UPI003EE1B7D3
MDKDAFLKGFQEQFDNDPESISFETKYKDLDEWSSMMALIIIAFVDESYEVPLTGDDFKSATTVGELADIVAQKIE